MMNNKVLVRMSEHLADRLKKVGNDPAKQITEAYRLTIGRSPSGDELAAMTAYAKEFGLANACRVMFNLNEFVFVD